MEEGRQHAPWLEVRGNHDNFDVKTRGGPQARARAQFLCILTVFRIHDKFFFGSVPLSNGSGSFSALNARRQRKTNLKKDFLLITF
jgi:hypothetical protein